MKLSDDGSILAQFRYTAAHGNEKGTSRESACDWFIRRLIIACRALCSWTVPAQPSFVWFAVRSLRAGHEESPLHAPNVCSRSSMDHIPVCDAPKCGWVPELAVMGANCLWGTTNHANPSRQRHSTGYPSSGCKLHRRRYSGGRLGWRCHARLSYFNRERYFPFHDGRE